MFDRVKWVGLVAACLAITACGQADTVVEDDGENLADTARATMLVYSETAAWRHEEGIPAANNFLSDLAGEKGYDIFLTEDSTVFSADTLAGYELVVFNNVTGDVLEANEKQAFQTWLEQGGAWLGLHGAGDDSHVGWTWYHQTLIGSRFIGHISDPQFQDADVVVLDTAHPVMAGVPERFVANEEWYSFDSPASAHGLRALSGLDETTYILEGQGYGGNPPDLRMGDDPADHPVMWATCLGEGKAFYSALGHQEQTYDNATYTLILENAIEWLIEGGPPSPEVC